MDLIILNKYYFPLLHGAGGKYDELIIFSGMGLILIGLASVSYTHLTLPTILLV